MVATSGDRLLATDAVAALRTRLIPRAFLITPNLPEAAALLDQPVALNEAAIESQGRRLLAMGCHAVLIKGGHGQGIESIDYLITAATPSRWRRRASRPKTPMARMFIVFRRRGGSCQSGDLENRSSRRQGWVSARSAPPAASMSATAYGPIHHFHEFY